MVGVLQAGEKRAESSSSKTAGNGREMQNAAFCPH